MVGSRGLDLGSFWGFWVWGFERFKVFWCGFGIWAWVLTVLGGFRAILGGTSHW